MVNLLTKGSRDHVVQDLCGGLRIARRHNSRNHGDAIGAGSDGIGSIGGVDAANGNQRQRGESSNTLDSLNSYRLSGIDFVPVAANGPWAT